MSQYKNGEQALRTTNGKLGLVIDHNIPLGGDLWLQSDAQSIINTRNNRLLQAGQVLSRVGADVNP